MDDPIFRMRAKVAQRAKGHAYEDRFMNLSGLKLVVAYRQAMKEEKDDFDLIKTLNDSWSKRFHNLFKALFMYTNPKMYAAFEDEKELESLRAEVKPEEFPDLWEEITKVIPDQIMVEDPQSDPLGAIPTLNQEMEEIIAGFVPYVPRKDGE